MISPDVTIMTTAELEQIKGREFQHGVERGRFEESCDRSNSKARGLEGHLEATENTGSASSDAAVRPADCIYPDCQIKTAFKHACEHSCPFESNLKQEKISDPDEITRHSLRSVHASTTGEQYMAALRNVREAIQHAFDLGFRAAGGQC